MVRQLSMVTVAAVLISSGGNPAAERVAASLRLPLVEATQPDEMCLMPPLEYGGAQAASQGYGSLPVPADWPGKAALGGDVPPVRIVFDPHPTYDGIGIDPENGFVVMSDENRASLLLYDAAAGGQSAGVTEPKRHIIGAQTKLGFQAGVALDPKRREILAISNDGGGFAAFSYDQHGDVKPIRELEVPHQAWGISLDLVNDEMAITSQQYQGISVFKRGASGTDRPIRTIRGEHTQLADPHGVFLDGGQDEVFTANHGNWTEMRSYADDAVVLPGQYVPGRFEQPSIRVHKASLDGDVPPLRSIQGSRTKLAWPMGLTVDRDRNEIVVANYGDSSILVFAVGANGDVAPTRILSGPQTGINGPIGVVIDTKRNELWVANYGDHTAVVFDRSASGNAAPKRIVRNAPAGTPTTGFTNASAAAYDSKRGELLVPN